MTDCILVDIDGTLADARHRLHHLQKTPKDWKAFYSEMDKDGPHTYMIELVKLLAERHTIILTSGRPTDYRVVTVEWLKRHEVPYELIYLRRAKDFRPDTIIKKEFLDQIKANRFEPKFAIDDRPDVVRMWRKNGLPCLQVDDQEWFSPVKGREGDVLAWLDWMESNHHEAMFKKAADEIRDLRRKLDKAILPPDEL